MDRAWVVDIVEKLPQAMVSRAWGWLARRRSPRVGVGLLKRTFVKAVGIDMSEAAEGMSHYQTLEDLFVRTLRPGARRIDPAPDAVVSPVDGTVGACGTVTEGTCFQVKGRAYNLARLLDDAEEAKRFEGGAYATLYLAPKDYHRIHAPVAGSVSKATLVPGALMPVFVEALHRVDELFARNERVITYLDNTSAGRVAVVKVGATLVGRISVAYDPEVRTNLEGQLRRSLAYDPPHLIQKGGELGAFELGSTVVLIAEPQRLTFEHLSEGASVRMGERIGSLAVSKKRSKRAGEAAEADGASSSGQR
jgi:phosphatidylserine decarboxylase